MSCNFSPVPAFRALFSVHRFIEFVFTVRLGDAHTTPRIRTMFVDCERSNSVGGTCSYSPSGPADIIIHSSSGIGGASGILSVCGGIYGTGKGGGGVDAIISGTGSVRGGVMTPGVSLGVVVQAAITVKTA